MPPKHFLQLKDFSRDELDYLFARTRWIKERFKRYEIYQPLRDRTLAMVFEKASTRTRVSFEAGMNQLGGIAINLNRGDTQLSRGEPIEDVARVISRMVDVVMIRTFEQTIIERFAAHSRVPVINGLTNEYHPVPDPRRHLHVHRASRLDPGQDRRLDRRLQQRLQHVAAGGGGVRLQRSRVDAARLRGRAATRRTPAATATTSRSPTRSRRARGADLVTTDVWTSMGFEAENDERKQDFARLEGRRGDDARAQPDALFMHCLPAHRGEEVAAEVIDGPQSVVWDEAENRLHAQKALLEYLVCGRVDDRGARDRPHRRRACPSRSNASMSRFAFAVRRDRRVCAALASRRDAPARKRGPTSRSSSSCRRPQEARSTCSARIIGDKLKDRLGQPIVVEDQPARRRHARRPIWSPSRRPTATRW